MTLLDALLDSRELPPTVEPVEAVEVPSVEVVVVVEPPLSKVWLSLKLLKPFEAAMALFAIDLEVESIDLDLAIDRLANFLDHLVDTTIDRQTMVLPLTILDCRRYPS